MDAVQKANAGHPGTAMALAPLAYLLYRDVMRHNPADPHWPGRDRFVLSAGHACILQYASLHLAGYDLTLEDLEQFRQWGSRTPGHPEHGHTAGIETTTGPLGQGFANGVGMAIAQRFLADRYNRPHHEIVDSWIYAICSDGDMMEGISSEAASIAGHLGLGRLVYVYDDNHITIDGTTSLTFTTEDKGKRFEAYGWHVQHVDDSEDLDALLGALAAAKAEEERPSLIVLRSHIAYPAPHAIDTAKAHGAPLGEAEVRATKEIMGFDPDATFAVSDAVREHMAVVAERGAELQREWEGRLAAWAGAFPELAQERELDLPRRAARGLARGAARVPGRRGGRDARRRPQGDAGPEAVHADDGGRVGRPRRVEQDRVRGRRRLLRDARGPQHRLRDPRARDGLDRERDRPRAGDAPALRLHLPDLLRLHAPGRSAVRPDGAARRRGSGRTTRSPSARTAPRTSPSSTTWRCGRSRTSGTSVLPTPTRRRWRGRSRSSGPTAPSRSR